MQARVGARGITLQLEDFALIVETGFYDLKMRRHHGRSAQGCPSPDIADRPIRPRNPARDVQGLRLVAPVESGRN
jgi:hypothetical protein